MSIFIFIFLYFKSEDANGGVKIIHLLGLISTSGYFYFLLSLILWVTFLFSTGDFLNLPFLNVIGCGRLLGLKPE